MRERRFTQPDAEKMESLLHRYRFDPTGVILSLAWREGLTRKEIWSLTWEQVDFEAKLLRLPDREIPLEEDVGELLRRWQSRCENFSPFVAVSPRLRKQMAQESITHLARGALDSVGMNDVRLQDLRYDFVRRQTETHDWPYVLRVAGLSVATYYQEGIVGGSANKCASAPESREDAGEEMKLWWIMQRERVMPAGIALWLTTQLGLQADEMVSLTWDQVDFVRSKLILGERELPMTLTLRHVLMDVLEGREPDDDPHVLLTVKSYKPMDAAWLTKVVRTSLIRGGIENKSLCDFRRNPQREDENRKIMEFVARNGSITRRQAVELLSLSPGQTYTRLRALADSGKLLLLNSKYYAADAVVHPEQQREAICTYLEQNGPSYCQDIVDLLHIGKRTTARILREMIASGDIVLQRPAMRYAVQEPAALPAPQERVDFRK